MNACAHVSAHEQLAPQPALHCVHQGKRARPASRPEFIPRETNAAVGGQQLL